MLTFGGARALVKAMPLPRAERDTLVEYGKQQERALFILCHQAAICLLELKEDEMGKLAAENKKLKARECAVEPLESSPPQQPQDSDHDSFVDIFN